MTEPSTPKKKLIPAWLKQILTVAVSAGILWHCLRDLNWSDLVEATRGAVLGVAIAAVIAPQLGMWITNTVSNAVTMTWFHGPFPFWKYFWVRGALFILQMVNNPLAQGGSLIYVQRRTGVTWTKLIGISFFRAQLGIWGFATFMVPITAAMGHFGADDEIKINMTGWWIFLIVAMIHLAWSWLYWRLNVDVLWLGRLIIRNREGEFWHAFQHATARQWLITWAIVLPQITIVLVGYYFLAHAFSVDVPFWECLVVMPLVLFISNLPIAFGGFGTTTLAWQEFFGQYGAADSIAALTLFIPAGRLLLRGLIGLISLPAAYHEVTTMSLLSGEQVAQDEE